MLWNLGFEYECFLPYKKPTTRKKVKALHPGIKVVDDLSLHNQPVDYTPCEIITPPLPEKQSIALMKKLNKFLIEEGAVANHTCGFHINLSFNKGSYQVNPNLLVACTDDLQIAREWKRTSNVYCKPWSKLVKQLDKEVQRQNKKYSYCYRPFTLRSEFETMTRKMFFQETTYDDGPTLQVLCSEDHTDKYMTVNISKLAKLGYVEYRMIGGSRYFTNDEPLLEAIDHFKQGQSIAHANRDQYRIDDYLNWARSQR